MVVLVSTQAGPREGKWEKYSFTDSDRKFSKKFSKEVTDYMTREPLLPKGESLWTKFVDNPSDVDPQWKMTFGEICLAVWLPQGKPQVSWKFPTATTRLYPASVPEDASFTMLRDALKAERRKEDCVVWVAFSLRCFRGDLDRGALADKCCAQLESIAVNEPYGHFTPYRGGLAYKGFLLAKAWAEHKARLLFGKPIQWQCATDATDAMKTVRNACILWGFKPLLQPARCEVATSEDLDEASRLDAKGGDKALAANAELLAKFTKDDGHGEWVSTTSLQTPKPEEHVLPELRSFYKSVRRIEESAAANPTFPSEFFVSLKWGHSVGLLLGDAILVVTDAGEPPRARRVGRSFRYWSEENGVKAAMKSLGLLGTKRKIFARINFSAHLLRKPTEPRRLTINNYERSYAFDRSDPVDSADPQASKDACSLSNHLFCLVHSLGELFTTLQPLSWPTSRARPLRVGLEPDVSRQVLKDLQSLAQQSAQASSAASSLPDKSLPDKSLPDKPLDSLIKYYKRMGFFPDPRYPDFMRSRKESVTRACNSCLDAFTQSGQAEAPMAEEAEPSEEDAASQDDASSRQDSQGTSPFREESPEKSKEPMDEATAEAMAEKIEALQAHVPRTLADAMIPPPPSGEESPEKSKEPKEPSPEPIVPQSKPRKAKATARAAAMVPPPPKTLADAMVPPPPKTPGRSARGKASASRASSAAPSARDGAETQDEMERVPPPPEVLVPEQADIEAAYNELRDLPLAGQLKVVRWLNSFGEARIYTRVDVNPGEVLMYYLGFLRLRPAIKQRKELMNKSKGLINDEIRVHENKDWDACVAAYLQKPGAPGKDGPARAYIRPFEDPRFCGADVRCDAAGKNANVGAFDVFCDHEDKLGLLEKRSKSQGASAATKSAKKGAKSQVDLTAKKVEEYRSVFGAVTFRKLPEDKKHHLYPNSQHFVTTLAIAPVVALRFIPKYTELVYDPLPIRVEGDESERLRHQARTNYGGMSFTFDGAQGLQITD